MNKALFAQQLLIFPYPHLATSKKGQSELWRQLGSLRRMIESLRLEKTPRISKFNL